MTILTIRTTTPIRTTKTVRMVRTVKTPRSTRAGAAGKIKTGARTIKPRSKKPLIIMAVVVVVLGIVGFFIWFAHRNQVSTDDAYTDGNTVTMVPKVSGYVVELVHRRQSARAKRRSAVAHRSARLSDRPGSGASPTHDWPMRNSSRRKTALRNCARAVPGAVGIGQGAGRSGGRGAGARPFVLRSAAPSR
jgi:cytoskeletal protein RodZ